MHHVALLRLQGFVQALCVTPCKADKPPWLVSACQSICLEGSLPNTASGYGWLASAYAVRKFADVSAGVEHAARFAVNRALHR